jgi:4-hydroxy-3-methylbut-2-en-1-yl diphosphate reductase
VSELLIAAPLRVEAALISSAARGARVRTTGMGPARARTASGELARDTAGGLLVLGFCGGLDAISRPGEVIVADEVLATGDDGHEPVRAVCHDPLRLAGLLSAAGLVVRRGPIVGVGRIATGERREQLRAAGALAVDMESAWLAAGAAGRPFDVVRVVLDSPSHELMRPQALGGALQAARVLRRVAKLLVQDRGTEG